MTDFVDAAEAQNLGLHSFLFSRHCRVVAEACWRFFAPSMLWH